MAEIKDYSVTADDNDSASPNGMPEGMAPSGVNNSWRESFARVKRWYEDVSAAKTTTGSSNAYVLAAARAVTAYAAGDSYMIKANHTCTSAGSTLNIDSVGAKSIVTPAGAALGAGDITSGGIYIVAYEASADKFMLLAGGSTFSGDITAKTSDGAILNLQTSDTTVTDGSVLGRTDFTAPDEASGTDAILLAASIAAISEGTFAADNNATKLSFQTGASAAASEKMSISSVGNVTMKETETGDDTPMTLLLQTGETDIAANDVLGKIEFQAPDEAAGTDAILVAAAIEAVSEGDFSSSNNATKLSFKTGASAAAAEVMSLSSAGNLTVSGDIFVGDDLALDSDAAILYFGADQDVSLTHVADTGLLLNSTRQLQFNDASQYINAPSATILDINATDEVEINATLADVNANLDVSGTYQGGGTMTTGGSIVIPDDGTIGSASDTDAISIRSDGNVGINSSGDDTSKLYIYDNTTTDKLIAMHQDHASNAQTALHITHDGTGLGIYCQKNAGTSSAVYGYNNSSSAGIAVRGHSVNGHSGYFATGSASHVAVAGFAAVTSNYGYLGYSTHGVFGTSVYCIGAMYKGSGTFRIPHPLKSEVEGEDWDLLHSFIEGPQCDLIYRGRATLVDGRATVSMDTKYGMTAGTFAWLTKDIQTFTSNETGWDAVKSSFSGDTITIECQNTSSTDTISWMVVAERDDPNIKASEITDDDGNLIIERPSEPPPPPPPTEPNISPEA